MNKLLKHHSKIVLILSAFIVAVYLLLSYKAPFSERTLVANTEPFPDTLYYGSPAWNAINGNGFTMKAFDYESKIITPPLYSLYLTPFFGVAHDVRSFYFANLILGIATLILFILTIRKIFSDNFGILVSAFLGFLYATNFYIYYIPSLLMAENITLFVSMLAVFLLVNEINKKNTIPAVITGTALSLIKFSNLPLTVSFFGLYFLKLLHSKRPFQLLKNYIVCSIFAGIFFASYIFLSGLLEGHKNLSSGAGFSSDYFLNNFSKYSGFLFGDPSHFIWYEHRMVNVILAFPIMLGIITGITSHTFRNISLQLLLYGLSVIIFMSAFYFVDARYILMLYPLLLIFTGILFYEIKKRISIKISIIGMILLVAGYLLLPQSGQITGERQLITIKKQIGLNFRHAETPWNYIAVQEFNEYFKKSSEKVYLGSFLPPYFVDFYDNGNYTYIPISMGQEFYYDRSNAPEPYLNNVPDFYKKLLTDGNDVYISSYYQNNQPDSWKNDFEAVTKDLILTKVHEGCLGACDIYKMTLKE